MTSERDFLNEVLATLHYSIAPQIAHITPRNSKVQEAVYDDVIQKMNALYTDILNRLRELPADGQTERER